MFRCICIAKPGEFYFEQIFQSVIPLQTMGESATCQSLRLAFVVGTLCLIANATNAIKNSREGKVFSLFNIVTFNNAQCTSNDVTNGEARLGTCFTTSECVARNGLLRGTCAAGFGICCVFVVQVTGGQVNQNCTYLLDPPVDAANAGAARTVMYTVNRINPNICSLRLDLDTFNIQGPVVPSVPPGLCVDQFSIQSNTGPITICGQNSGEHIYVDIADMTSSRIDVTLPVVTGTVTREWDIKVSQIPCSSSFGPPPGCFQYHTENTGRIISLNFNGAGGHLQDQMYSICIRQTEGFCCVRYQECPLTVDSFTFDDPGTSVSIAENGCLTDYIVIGGSSSIQSRAPGTAVRNRYCSPFLNFFAGFPTPMAIFDCTPPFSVGLVTDDIPTAPPNRGLCLEYMQLTC